MEKNNKQNREGIFKYPDGFLDDDLPKGALSPSSFNLYRRCAKQYCYRYVEELGSSPNVKMFKGIIIHFGVEVIHKRTIEKQELMSFDEASSLVSDEFDAKKDDVENWEGAPECTLKDAIINNVRVYYVHAVPTMRPLAAEKPFMIKMGGVPIRGIIDLVDQVPGEYALGDDPEKPPPLIHIAADLKTTARAWPEQKLLYEPQFTIYAIAENTQHIRADFMLDQKSGTKYVPKRALRSVNEKRVITEDVVEVASLIKKGIFPRCDPTGWSCTAKFCGFFERCRGGK